MDVGASVALHVDDYQRPTPFTSIPCLCTCVSVFSASSFCLLCLSPLPFLCRFCLVLFVAVLSFLLFFFRRFCLVVLCFCYAFVFFVFCFFVFSVAPLDPQAQTGQGEDAGRHSQGSRGRPSEGRPKSVRVRHFLFLFPSFILLILFFRFLFPLVHLSMGALFFFSFVGLDVFFFFFFRLFLHAHCFFLSIFLFSFFHFASFFSALPSLFSLLSVFSFAQFVASLALCLTRANVYHTVRKYNNLWTLVLKYDPACVSGQWYLIQLSLLCWKRVPESREGGGWSYSHPFPPPPMKNAFICRFFFSASFFSVDS